MTFSDLRTDLRLEILQESDTSFFSDAQLLSFLIDASVEIAGAASIPEGTSSSAVALSASTIGIPTSTSAIKSVTISGLQLSPASFSEVKVYQAMTGIPRYFNWNPARAGVIQIAPPMDQAGTASIEYVKDISGVTYTGGAQPWGGVLQEWTDLIKYYAGVKAFEMSMEYTGQKSTYQLEPSGDKSVYWMTRFRQRLVEFGGFLGNNDIVKQLLVENPRSYVRDTSRMVLQQQQQGQVPQ